MREKPSGEKRFGFIDTTGKLVIGFDRLPQTTIAVGDFYEGRARIYVSKGGDSKSKGYMNDTVGFIDQTGKMIIEPRFDLARDFSEGLAYVEAKDFKGFIDRFGKVVIKLDYRFTKDFHEGVAAVRMGDRQPDSDWGYIDRSGKLVIKRQYSFADDFSEGLAGVEADRKYGFINKRGEMVIQPRFDVRKAARHPAETISSGLFSEGLACVRVGARYGFVNRNGEFVIPPQFSHAQGFSEGLAWVVASDSKIGWIDKTGKWVVTGVDGLSFSYRMDGQLFAETNELEDWSYSDGLQPFNVYSGGKFLRGYMDQKGRAVIKLNESEYGYSFVGGIAKVSLPRSNSQEEYGYINRKGQFIWRSK